MAVILWLLNLFNSSNDQTIYLYYNMILFALFTILLGLNLGRIKKYIKITGRIYPLLLLLIIALFIVVELLFVTPTHLLYNDEYSYASIAKTILTNHIAGVCANFAAINYCIPNTTIPFHQPVGWPFLLALTFYIFGTSFSTGYYLTLLVAAMGILILFYTTLLITGNQKTALASSAIFAFTPLFMTFSRSTIADLPAAIFGILSIFFLLLYLRTRSLSLGSLAVVSIAITMDMKVDAVIIIPIIILILLLNKSTFKRRWTSRNIFVLLLLIIFSSILLLPEFIFITTVYSSSFGPFSFGQSSSQLLFGLEYFYGNAVPNILFWFGEYTNQHLPLLSGSYTYHTEYPLSFSLFALIGVAVMLAKKKFRQFGQLAVWFLIPFVFYTSYYGGGVLYGFGDDVRYFTILFPVISILAATGIVALYDYAIPRLHRAFERRAASNHTKIILAIILTMLLFSNSIIQFVNIVHASPYKIIYFTTERHDERFVEATLPQIPSNCLVVSSQTSLWYILGRASIYTSLSSMPYYKGEIANLSKGCVYYDKSPQCYLNYENVNGSLQCKNFTSTHMLIPINISNIQEYNNGYMQNITIGIYKVVSYNQST